MSSHVTVVESIIQGLKYAGVKDKNIIVFERYNRELETAGFRVRRRQTVFDVLGPMNFQAAVTSPNCNSPVVSEHVLAK